MASVADIRWFKDNFHTEAKAAVAGTPFDLDMLTALALQETGHIWGVLRKKPGMTPDKVLELCVGDTIDGPRRKAFPTSRKALEAIGPNGVAMFKIGRKALEDMAAHVPGFEKMVQNPDKFCHGYGIFQYDLQFLKESPDYFSKGGYKSFAVSVARAVTELKTAQDRAKLKGRAKLSDLEMAHVAIAYNTGGFNPAKGLKQGSRNDAGQFYGELFFEFLRLARTVPDPATAAAEIPKPPPGQAPVAPPTPVPAGVVFEVDTTEDVLLLRETPEAKADKSNVRARLPDGHRVRAVSETPVNGFLEVETSLRGALLRGFAGAKFLKKVAQAAVVPVAAPAPKPPTGGPKAVHMPVVSGRITTRKGLADAHSLNEAGQPGRKGTTAAERVAEIGAIIDWLDVENPAHRRYQPRNNMTFCNIYAHDFCHLAGAYVPRVWWSGPALVAIGKGQAVVPKIGDTIREMRANDLLRWLEEFGGDFGWRETGELAKLQAEVNLGALGLLVARRVENAKPGHIVMVVPETDQVKARRDAAGAVLSPVQSQAGAVNAKRSAGKTLWWRDKKFASFAFWLHA